MLYAQVQARNKNISNYLKFGKRSRIIINVIPSTHERPAFKHYIEIFVLLLDTIPEYLGKAQGNGVKVNNGKNILFKEMPSAWKRQLGSPKSSTKLTSITEMVAVSSKVKTKGH